MKPPTPAPDEDGATDAAHRAFCVRCFKPRSACICGLPVVRNRTFVHVLQHPRERAHPIGTARFVELGLARSEVVVASTPARDLRTRWRPPPGAALLYPSEGARLLSELRPSERPERLVVLDGTWPQARSLYRQNAWLARLPHVALAPDAPSRYRIRREPAAHCLSTLESVVLALRALEPELSGVDDLLLAFDAMVDRQLDFIARSAVTGEGRRLRKDLEGRRFVGIPRWLAEGHPELVAVYVEAEPRRAGARRSLLQIAAVRLSDGALFDRRCTPTCSPIDADALGASGLSPDDFADAIPAAVALDELRTFAGTRALFAFNRSAPGLLHEATGRRPKIRLLKPVLGALAGRGRLFDDSSRVGTLDEAVAVSCGAQPALALRGRASGRLANLRGLSLWLRERCRVDG